MDTSQLELIVKNQELFFYWLTERDSIRQKKEAGLPKPWTTDPILQKYKFCNVRREDDTVTKWIKNNWRDPCRGHPNMWFAMVVARLFNWPPTLDLIGFPLSDFNDIKEQWRHKLKAYREQGNKVFTGAYLVSTNGVSMDKIDYVLDRVLTPIWERGRSPLEGLLAFERTENEINVRPDTLESYWKYLTQFDGLGSFMAGQVVADLKYVDPVLEHASDWLTFAPLGPGSIRGLNRFHGRVKEKPLKQEQGLRELNDIRARLSEEYGIDLPVHDIQNCCCEFDKMVRLLRSEGKTRSRYNGLQD